MDEKRKIGNRWYTLISTADVEAGDVVRYYLNGNRWRLVKSVTKKRIRLVPVKYGGAVIKTNNTIPREAVVSAWSKRKEAA